MIYPYTEATTSGWNDANGTHVTKYDIDDEGSIWSIEASGKSEADLIAEAATAKANALALIEAAELADYFTYSDDAIAAAKAAVKDLDVATKVSVELQRTAKDLRSRDRIVKKSEKSSLYESMDISSITSPRFLERGRLSSMLKSLVSSMKSSSSPHSLPKIPINLSSYIS